MEKNKIIFLVGIPGAGKSTWAREYLKGKPNTIIISRDAFRRARGTYWVPKQEPMISTWCIEAFKAALYQGEDIIIDNTNLKISYYGDYIKAWREYMAGSHWENDPAYTPYIKIIDTPLEECIYRNTVRPEAERVAQPIVENFYKDLQEFKKQWYVAPMWTSVCKVYEE